MDTASFIVGMIMVRKWFNVKNKFVTINALVGKVAKEKGGAISPLNTIRVGEGLEISENQNVCMIKIEIAWQQIFIMIVYEVITLIIVVLVVKLFKHVYRLCNFTNL